MTNKDDLPSVIERGITNDDPNSPSPSAGQVAKLVQQRLDQKKPEDYITDVDPEDGNGGDDTKGKYGLEYDAYVNENNIVAHSKETIQGVKYDIDNSGYIIYRGDDASEKLDHIRDVLEELLVKLKNGEIDKTYVSDEMDRLLFYTYQMSMLSDGIRDFYIYKHAKLDEF